MEVAKYKITNELHCQLGEQQKRANKVQIKFEDLNFTFDLETEFQIKEDDVLSAMVWHTVNFGWWSSLKFLAQSKLKTINREIEYHINETTNDVKQILKSHQDRATKLTEAEALGEIVEFITHVLQTFEHKRDMLKQINRAQCSPKTTERYN